MTLTCQLLPTLVQTLGPLGATNPRFGGNLCFSGTVIQVTAQSLVVDYSWCIHHLVLALG